MRVAVGRFYFDHAFADFENGNIECSAAEVENGDRFVFFLVQTVSQRGGGRFVDDAHYFETGDFTGVFRRLTLCVVKVCRNGDDRFIDFRAEIIFG